MTDVKQELAKKAGTVTKTPQEVKLTKNMSISDMIKALEPEIKRALPSVLTPERFTRMALSALNTTPKLAECSPMTFIAALLNAAQLGLEPNTPLGQAYLIPYKNKGKLECQFQIGYKGMIDLAYRTGQVQMIQAQIVREADYFVYEYGLEPKLIHRPAESKRGEIRYIYGVFRLANGGFGFEVANKAEIDQFARTYSQSYGNSYSPWTNNYEEMAKKTVIKRALKYAPIQTDFQRAISEDCTIKSQFSVDMGEIRDETVIDGEYSETGPDRADQSEALQEQ